MIKKALIKKSVNKESVNKKSVNLKKNVKKLYKKSVNLPVAGPPARGGCVRTRPRGLTAGV